MATQVQGARAVRADLQTLIDEQHREALTLARADWGWTSETMPPLEFIDAYETEVIDSPPQVAVNITELTRLRHSDLDEQSGREVYEATYNVSVYLWVKATLKDDRRVLRLRDDYTTIIRSIILASQGINSLPSYRVDQNSLRETYSPPEKAKGDRWLAAGRVQFTVVHEETLWRAEGWYVDKPEVTATLLPRTDDEE